MGGREGERDGSVVVYTKMREEVKVWVSGRKLRDYFNLKK